MPKRTKQRYIVGMDLGGTNIVAGAMPEDGSRQIAERITHQEISSRVGCSREMVSRILKDLESGAYIRVNARRITLVKNLPLRW